MRLALISDIHGNLISLEAVLADIQRAAVDDIIFLGDLATLGPQPREVVARVQALRCVCITGNHDSFLFDRDALHTYSDAPWFKRSLDWCLDQLTPADLDFIHSFQPVAAVTLDPEFPRASKLLCYHGSPRSNVELILATTPKKKLKKMFHGHKAGVMAGGHTHVQLVRQYKGQFIVNAGSVGLPFRESPVKGTPRVLPWAEYAIVGWQQGTLSVDLRRVPVDLDAAKQAAFASTLPERLEWIENWQSYPSLW